MGPNEFPLGDFCICNEVRTPKKSPLTISKSPKKNVQKFEVTSINESLNTVNIFIE